MASGLVTPGIRLAANVHQAAPEASGACHGVRFARPGDFRRDLLGDVGNTLCFCTDADLQNTCVMPCDESTGTELSFH